MKIEFIDGIFGDQIGRKNRNKPLMHLVDFFALFQSWLNIWR